MVQAALLPRIWVKALTLIAFRHIHHDRVWVAMIGSGRYVAFVRLPDYALVREIVLIL